MPSQKQPSQPRSTEEILREMEDMARESGSDRPAKSSGGGLKSFLDFFVKFEPEEPEGEPGAGAPKPKSAAAHSKQAPGGGTRVGDLVAGEPAPKFTHPQTSADLSSKPFDEIYREAGITGSPCSVDELATLMENPAVASQPLSDAFQAMLDERAGDAEQRNLAKIQQLTLETEEYLKRRQAEMEALRQEIAEAKRQSLDFSARREAEEKRLANLIAPFLEGNPNPVTVGVSQIRPTEKTKEG